jgi:DeoR/GlpR family transcriptional regulator of sugar metabolism
VLGAARRQRILERLATARQIEISSLSGEFGCSPETLRRDLRALEQTGQLRRVHGGAVRVAREEMPPVDRRIDRQRQAKAIIADLAAEHIAPGSMIFLGAGSTALAVAVRLVDLPPTNFVTNMVEIAVLLGRNERHKVFLAGGLYNGATKATESPETFEFLASRVFDLAVLGISAIDLAHGYMGPTDQHVWLVHLIKRQSRRLMIVCDATKFGRTDSYNLLAFRDVDLIVTDQPPPPLFMQKLKEVGTTAIFSTAGRGAGRDVASSIP